MINKIMKNNDKYKNIKVIPIQNKDNKNNSNNDDENNSDRRNGNKIYDNTTQLKQQQ